MIVFGLNYRRYVLIDATIVSTKIKVMCRIELIFTIDTFVTDKIGQTTKNIATSFAFVNDITFVGE